MSEQSHPEHTYNLREERTEALAQILEPSLIQTMTDAERAAVRSIVSIGPGDAIETPLIRAAFPNATLTLVEKDQQLANINRRRFDGDAQVLSIHADASLPDAKKYLESDLAIIRNPNITLDPQTWQEIVHTLSEKLHQDGLLYLTTIHPDEMDLALKMISRNGFTPLEGEPRTHRTLSIDDTYTLRANRSKID